MNRIFGAASLSILASAALLAIGCSYYHLDAYALIGLVGLILFVLLPGASVVGLLKLDDRFSRAECVALAASIGFIMAAVVMWVEALTGVTSLDAIYVALFGSTIAYPRQRFAIGQTMKLFVYALPLAIILVLCYNLAAFHYTGDGSIVARGLWGVDIPFLAGELHGLKQFGHLVDFHQSALPWDYHDATYRILTLFTRFGTLDLLAWVVPIFGYCVMAVGVYAVADRVIHNRIAALSTVVLWFFSGAVKFGTELSFAISPSFLFGTIIFCGFIIALDEWRFSGSTKLGLLVLSLLIALSRFKLSTFLVAEFALGIQALWQLRSDRRAAFMTSALAVVGGLQLLAVGAPTNPLTPASDFLVGAPLLGYANHLAKWLHVSVSSINPVTRASLSVKSLLVPLYFIFHFLRFVVLDPRLLVALIAGFFIVRRLTVESPAAQFLYISIPIGFLLPVLYSPAWYPLALSFYAPLVSVQSAVIVLGLTLDRWMRRYQPRWRVWVVAAALLASVAINLRQMTADVRQPAFVVSSELRSALNWIHQTGKPGTIAGRRYDLDPHDSVNDESFYWYSAISGQPVITEGAKYGSLLGAVADVDREKGLHRVRLAELQLRIHRAENGWIFYSGDTTLVYTTIRKLPVRYLIERTTPAMLDEQVHVDLSRIGRIGFQKGNVRVWQFY